MHVRTRFRAPDVELLLTSTDDDGIVRLRGGSEPALLLPATDLGTSSLAQPARGGLETACEVWPEPRAETKGTHSGRGFLDLEHDVWKKGEEICWAPRRVDRHG